MTPDSADRDLWQLSAELLGSHIQLSAADPDVRSGKGPLLKRPRLAPIRSGIEKRHVVVAPSLSVEGPHDTEPLSVRKGSPRMPAKNAKTESDGFSAAERAA